MIRVVVLHGAHGGPDTNWFPWLQNVLELQGVEVLRPRLPTPKGQSLVSWLNTYDDVIGRLPALPTVLVGHSLGAAFALRLVERSEEPLAGLLLAAGFLGALGLPNYDQINASFFATPFDWSGIQKRKGKVCKCWAGDDDPYVPLARSQEVADKLGPDLEVVAGGRHLNSETGFNEFPQLRDVILRNQARFAAQCR